MPLDGVMAGAVPWLGTVTVEWMVEVRVKVVEYGYVVVRVELPDVMTLVAGQTVV